MQERGYVYGQQKMIAQFSCTGDWLFYVEGDEVYHENDLNKILESMKANYNNINRDIQRDIERWPTLPLDFSSRIEAKDINQLKWLAFDSSFKPNEYEGIQNMVN